MSKYDEAELYFDNTHMGLAKRFVKLWRAFDTAQEEIKDLRSKNKALRLKNKDLRSKIK